MIDTTLAQRLVQGKPWHHDFEIVPGVRTFGSYNPSHLWQELRLPEDLSGVSLADVGASNGFFSFEARRRGARVVAFDFRHKDNSGFGLAQYINGMSDIEHHQVNVLRLTARRFGHYDVVLALGLLYHVSDPYLGLANCAALAKKRLLVESYCLDASLDEHLREQPIMRFLPYSPRFQGDAEIGHDRSNFWAFTSRCLSQMVEDVGFLVRRSRVNGDRVLIDAERDPGAQNTTRLPIAYGEVPARPAGPDKSDPDAWVIL